MGPSDRKSDAEASGACQSVPEPPWRPNVVGAQPRREARAGNATEFMRMAFTSHEVAF
jgi:hypothetical protein